MSAVGQKQTCAQSAMSAKGQKRAPPVPQSVFGSMSISHEHTDLPRPRYILRLIHLSSIAETIAFASSLAFERAARYFSSMEIARLTSTVTMHRMVSLPLDRTTEIDLFERCE